MSGDKKEQFEHLNDQGLLITVIAFVLIVAYADGKYDIFDCFTGFVGLSMALRFLVHGRSEHNWLSGFLSGALISASLGIFVLYIIQILGFDGFRIEYNNLYCKQLGICEKTEEEKYVLSDFFVSVIMFAVGTFISIKKAREFARKILLKICFFRI